MDERIERIEKWAEGKRAGPFLTEIWPTNRCNLKCVMCGTWANRRKMAERGVEYNPSEEEKNEISEERLLEIVRECAELGTKEFLITGGGEPFIRKSTTLKLMEEIKALNRFGNLNTNGTLLDDEDMRRIIEIGWDRIMFSVDAPYAKIHDHIRGVRGCFARVKENLMKLKREKKRLKADKPRVVFNTVLSNKIYDKIDKMIKFAASVGCEDITFIPLIPYDEYAGKIKLNEREKMWIKERIAHLLEISRRLGVNTNLGELDLSISSDKMDELVMKEIEHSPKDVIHSPCFDPFLHFLIKADGEATFCCMIENSPENVKKKSVEKIWFGRYFNEQRKNFIDKRIRDECKFCVFSQFVRNKRMREELVAREK